MDATPKRAVLVSPKRTSLPSVLPVVWTTPAACYSGVRLVLGVTGVAHPGPEYEHHRPQKGGAVANTAHHFPERVGKGKRDAEE